MDKDVNGFPVAPGNKRPFELDKAYIPWPNKRNAIEPSETAGENGISPTARSERTYLRLKSEASTPQGQENFLTGERFTEPGASDSLGATSAATSSPKSDFGSSNDPGSYDSLGLSSLMMKSSSGDLCSLGEPGSSDSPSASAPEKIESQSVDLCSSKDPGADETICLGTICDVCIELRNAPTSPSKSLNVLCGTRQDFFRLELVFHTDRCTVRMQGGDLLGVLASRTFHVLKHLSRLNTVEFVPMASLEEFAKASTSWRKHERSTRLLIEINVYSHDRVAKEAGKSLSAAGIFLQPPMIDFRNFKYENPQYLKLPDVSLESQMATQILDERQQTIASPPLLTKELEEVMDHLPQPKYLRLVSTDARVTTNLEHYQREAVDFLLRREVGDLPLSSSLWKREISESGLPFYQHKITKSKSPHPQDFFGGVLADDMGLGKSLTVLTAILTSIDQALAFSRRMEHSTESFGQTGIPSNATLIVVPSGLLIDSWTEEVQKHFVPGALRTYKYHSFGRNIHPQILANYDIVFTTYATATAEFCRGRSLLNAIYWYRLVLDEAHVIRNRSTKQFRALSSIPAYIRWCVTGTPIQNSLEDLGSLLKFMRVPIFEELSVFRKYILFPALRAKEFSNLRTVFGCLCLRRTKELLKLPMPEIQTLALKLSQSEAVAYSEIESHCRRAIDMSISGKSSKKINQNILETLLRLRLYCNHGVNSTSPQTFTNGLPSDPEEALSYLQTNGSANCAYCDCDITSISRSSNFSLPSLTICQHLICVECLPRYEADLSESLRDGNAHCPLCERVGPKDSFLGWSKPGIPTQNATTAPPTKLVKLVSMIKSQKPNDRSLVFSFWKKTLDKVVELLVNDGVDFLRIDGSDSLAARRQVLSQFQSQAGAHVLLMTIGTGAVGLNKLSVANHVHLVEPQWNPSVESQAIGRVFRLGQRRNVTIFKYHMERTIEATVRSQQLRKLQLSRGGFNLGRAGQNAEQLKEIAALLCPYTAV